MKSSACDGATLLYVDRNNFTTSKGT